MFMSTEIPDVLNIRYPVNGVLIQHKGKKGKILTQLDDNA
jgi:hypothetical protein